MWAFLSASKPNGEWEWRGGGTFLKSSCWVSLVEFIPPLQGSSQKSGIHGMVRRWWEGWGTAGCCQANVVPVPWLWKCGGGHGDYVHLCVMPRPEYISVFSDWSTGSRTISFPCCSLRIGCSTWSLLIPSSLSDCPHVGETLLFIVSANFSIYSNWINVLRGEKDSIRFKRKIKLPGFTLIFQTHLIKLPIFF